MYHVHGMRAHVRVLVPLLAVLALLAYGATSLLNSAARNWFERDVATRARLAVSGARDALVTRLAAEDRRRLGTALDALVRDEHVVGAAACGPAGESLARTRGLPSAFDCAAVAARVGRASRDFDFSDVFEDRAVRVSVVPLREGGEPLGSVVLVHDMSYAAHRESSLRRITFAIFAVVALLAAIATVLSQRVSWRSWTDEFRARAPPEPWLADGALVARTVPAAPRRRPPDGSRARDRGVPRERRALVRRAAAANAAALLRGGRDRGRREPRALPAPAHPGGGVQVVRPSSGLVTALEPVMRACSGTWIAHGSGSADRETVDRDDHVSVPPGEDSYTLRRVWLSEDEERGYYYGFSNEGLWPLCHAAHTRPTFRAVDWREYRRVNERFADAACAEVSGPDPIILVQDYHFALVPALIRERLPRANVITFWHIPWPTAEQLGTCPFAKELLTGLLGSSVLGFHTQLHCNNFLESVDRFLEARIDREAQAVVVGGRESLVRSYPISIDWPNRVAEAVAPAADCRRTVFEELGLEPDALLGVGVDRLDYTKGIEERLLAVERLLERFPHLRGRFTFVQLASPSRTLIDRYRLLDQSVEALTIRINGRFGSGGYRPIVLLRANHAPEAVFRFLRAADVCYVSSLHDGMNLVAKEFVAARDDERGVLVLSRFTGAARELTEALVVNPYDLEEASAALATAVAMPAREQLERMRTMRGQVAEFNVYRWAGRMLADAARVRQRGRLSDRLSMGLHTVEELHG